MMGIDQQPHKPQIINYLTHNLDFTPFDVKWIPGTARIVVVGQHPRGTGAIRIFEMDDGKLTLISQDDKASAIKCITFGSSTSRKQFASGTFDGRVQLWDCERLKIPIFSVKGHEQIVNAIDGAGHKGYGAPELITGSKDGYVRVWDTRLHESPVAEIEPVDCTKARDCWTVAFGNDVSGGDRCIVAGYDNGDVKMIDLRNMSLIWETNVGNGVCSVDFDRNDILMNKMVVGGLEGVFKVFDLRTLHTEKGFANLTEKISESSTIWAAKHLPQNRDVFMISEGAGNVNLYQYHYPPKRSEKDKSGKEYGIVGTVELLNKGLMADQPICAFDWSPDKLGLCAFTSFDQTVRINFITKLNKIY